MTNKMINSTPLSELLDQNDDEPMLPCMSCGDEYEEGELEGGLCFICVEEDEE